MGPSLTLIPTYNYQIWLEKPVFGFWIHWLSTQVFGLNNFGLRAFSSLFLVASIFVFFLILKKFYSLKTSFLTSLAFALCPLIFFTHFIRSADFDTYFLFFTLLSIWIYIISWEKPKLFWMIGLSLGLGMMVRGYIIFLIIAVIISHLIITNKYKKIRLRNIIYALCVFLIITLPWHIYAFWLHPQIFIDDYLGYHFFARITSVLDNHRGSNFYYLKYLFGRLNIFFLFFIASFVYVLKKVFRDYNPIDMLWLFWLLIIVISLQIMQTKIIWYIFAALPAMFCLIASTIEDLLKRQFVRKKIFIYFGIAISMAYFYFSFFTAFSYVLSPSKLPIDSLDDYLATQKIKPEIIIIYSNFGTLNGPSFNFQLSKLQNYSIVKYYNSSEIFSNLFDSSKKIIFTDIISYRQLIIEYPDLFSQWQVGPVLNYSCDDWNTCIIPIIMKPKID
jgi:4-amino-4-deoxy-L-arabinose transferase-like glycosyltransferase